MPHTIEDLLMIMQQHERSAVIFSELVSLWTRVKAEELGVALSLKGAASANDREEAEAFLARYRSLDSTAQSRFMFSPHLSEYLEEPSASAYVGEHPGDLSMFENLCSALEREALLATLREGGSISPQKCDRIDSPLGDRFALKDDAGWRLYASKRIAGVIAFDVDSDITLRHEPDSGTFCQPRFPISAVECEKIIEKLEAAIALIDEAIPAFGLMIRTFTRRVIVRKTIEAGEDKRAVLGSEYRPIHTGCIRLLNVHRAEMTVILCAEAILHESVHSFLATYEAIYGKFMSTGIRFRPVSPWSGNYIPNHSLAHAVFVYYALHEMFRQVVTCPELELELKEAVRSRLFDFAAGFCINVPLSSLFFLDDSPAAYFTQVIDKMQLDVRNNYVANDSILRSEIVA